MSFCFSFINRYQVKEVNWQSIINITVLQLDFFKSQVCIKYAYDNCLALFCFTKSLSFNLTPCTVYNVLTTMNNRQSAHCTRHRYAHTEKLLCWLWTMFVRSWKLKMWFPINKRTNKIFINIRSFSERFQDFWPMKIMPYLENLSSNRRNKFAHSIQKLHFWHKIIIMKTETLLNNNLLSSKTTEDWRTWTMTIT